MPREQVHSRVGSPWYPQGPVALPFCHVRLTARKPSPAAYPKEMKTLGDHLRKRRLDLGLLQREVADRLGVTKDTIHNWESNHKSSQFYNVCHANKSEGQLIRRT